MRPPDILLNHLGEEFLILTDKSIQLVVCRLNSLCLLEAAPGEGAGEQSNGGTRGEDAFGVVTGDGRWWANSEAVGYSPVLDDLHKSFPFGILENGRV